MENNITTLPAEGNRQTAKRNPLVRFFSAANRKRKQIITSVTTMVTMAMANRRFRLCGGQRRRRRCRGRGCL